MHGDGRALRRGTATRQGFRFLLYLGFVLPGFLGLLNTAPILVAAGQGCGVWVVSEWMDREGGSPGRP